MRLREKKAQRPSGRRLSRQARTGIVAGLCLTLVASAGGCSVISGGSGGNREMTVYLPKARSFYKQSKVKVMGADVGLVDTVKPCDSSTCPGMPDDRIKVTFHLKKEVPLPQGVQASIVPLNLVGERNLVLHPAWKPGQPKETSSTIPIERTSVPVEVDDALSSFTNLANALDPTKMQTALGQAAATVNGNGKDFNATLEQGARLVQNVAGQDKELIEVAQNLSKLAGVVRGREQVLGSMIRNFGEATRVLSSERGEIQDLISGILDLSKNGSKLIEKYKGQLPYDLAVLTKTSLMLKGNAKQLGLLLSSLPGVGKAFIGGYNDKNKSLQIRLVTDAVLRTWLQGLLNKDGIDCPLPAPNSNCPWMNNNGQKGGN